MKNLSAQLRAEIFHVLLFSQHVQWDYFVHICKLVDHEIWYLQIEIWKDYFLYQFVNILLAYVVLLSFLLENASKQLRRVKAHSLRYKYNIICLCGISWSFNEEKKFIFMKFRSVLNLPSLFLRSNNFVFVLGDSRSCFPTRHLCFITSWGCATLIVQYR